ncbi:MAG: putative sigma-54 modulation protein [Candidatus Omnitrophota bacterium]|jgi:putative sigma-54 modulation protein
MNIDVSGRNPYSVPDTLKGYALEKMHKIDKFNLKIESAHLVFSDEKLNKTVEIVLAGKNLRLTASETDRVMQSAFDIALSNMENQLRKFHDKIKDHRNDKIKIVDESNEDEFEED